MHWKSVLAIALGTAIYRGFVAPAQARFAAWKADPNRVPVARPNWRGIYVPDLALIRFKRLLILGYLSIPVFGILSLLFIVPHVQG